MNFALSYDHWNVMHGGGGVVLSVPSQVSQLSTHSLIFFLFQKSGVQGISFIVIKMFCF